MLASGLRSFITQLSSGAWKQSIKLLKQSDVIIIGGGGLFYEQEKGHKGSKNPAEQLDQTCTHQIPDTFNIGHDPRY